MWKSIEKNNIKIGLIVIYFSRNMMYPIKMELRIFYSLYLSKFCSERFFRMLSNLKFETLERKTSKESALLEIFVLFNLRLNSLLDLHWVLLFNLVILLLRHILAEMGTNMLMSHYNHVELAILSLQKGHFRTVEIFTTLITRIIFQLILTDKEFVWVNHLHNRIVSEQSNEIVTSTTRVFNQ